MSFTIHRPSFIETIQSSVVCENGKCYGYPIKHAVYSDGENNEFKGLGRFADLSVPFWYGHKIIPPSYKRYNINYFTDDEMEDVTDMFDLDNADSTMCDDRFANVVDSIKLHDKKIAKTKKQGEKTITNAKGKTRKKNKII